MTNEAAPSVKRDHNEALHARKSFITVVAAVLVAFPVSKVGVEGLLQMVSGKIHLKIFVRRTSFLGHHIYLRP